MVTQIASRQLARSLLDNCLPSDADFNAFVIDHYPDISRRFSASMDRTTKINIMFEQIADLQPMIDLLICQCEPTKLAIDNFRFSNIDKKYNLLQGLMIPARISPVSLPGRSALISKAQNCLETNRNDYVPQINVRPILQKKPTLVHPQNRPHGDFRGVDQEELELPREELVEFLLCMERLLLVGMPGAGKTQILRFLCEQLLEKAKADPFLPVPFILNLSTFSRYRGHLRDWLSEGLMECASIPVKIGQELLNQGCLLFLLDGVDEMAVDRRSIALMELNELVRIADPAVSRCVVCSRTLEYLNAKVPLILSAALELQPLSPYQVKEAVTEAGSSDNLRAVLDRDETLATVLKTPLLLTIAMRGVEDTPACALTAQQPEEIRKNLYDAYIVQMLRRAGADPRFNAKRSLIWLRWLAQYLNREQSSLLLVERLQPTTLTSVRRYCLAFGLIRGLAFGLSFGLPLGLFCGPIWGLIHGACTGLLAGLGGSLIRRLFFGVLLGCLYVKFILYGLCGFEFDIYIILFICLIGAPLGALISLIIGTPQDQGIIPVELLSWSWSRAKSQWKRHLGQGMLMGLIASIPPGFVVFIFVLSFSTAFKACRTIRNFEGKPILYPIDQSNPLSDALKFGLSVALIVALSTGIICWLTRFIVGGWVKAMDQESIQPNQGIRDSLTNGVKEGLLPGFIAGLFFGVSFYHLMGHSLDGSLFFGFTIGLWIWLAFGLNGGLGETLKHGTLRLCLYAEGKLPLVLISWLEACRARLLLRRQGGAYLFWHITLQNHFAEMDDSRLLVLTKRINNHHDYLQNY